MAVITRRANSVYAPLQDTRASVKVWPTKGPRPPGLGGRRTGPPLRPRHPGAPAGARRCLPSAPCDVAQYGAGARDG